MSVICQLYIYDIIYPLLASYITHLAILVKVLHFTSYLRVTNYVGLLYITLQFRLNTKRLIALARFFDS